MIVRPVLASMVEDISFEDLPSNWSLFDIKTFSKTKKLWDFQQEAVKNIIKCLYVFFKEERKDKSNFYRRYGLDKDLDKTLSIKLSKVKRKVAELSQQFYTVKNDVISFDNFVNRAAFWMATASGKTLVIVKLIEILRKLMASEEIPKNDILVLTYREDLINQLKKHVNDFNELAVERGLKINFRELTEYESIKRENLVSFFNELNVFYYRSDLIGDEQKEKIVDFRNYENGGNWYIILDEAHKGDKEESKRQMIYSIISRNGFLFNFSATFVDNRDIVTTVYNFNLERFIYKGYGKHMYLLKQEIRAFKEKEDYNRREKQKIVLKSLILLSYIKKVLRKLRKINKITKNVYHNPLMLTLVNTVNLSGVKKEQPDLKLFFNEIEKIGSGEVDSNLFEEAIKELLEEFSDTPVFEYEEDTQINIDDKELRSITLKDILRTVYNAESSGSIEALTIPEKRQEVIFKLKTSDKPFALIKIGDAIKWIKDNLKGYEVNESYEDRSIFENIEERKEISVLMGSRAFYEGWDSNRPNLILFINIGIGNDAKKFVMQSIGRGVRIEPLKNKRRRLKNLLSKGEDEDLFLKIGGDSITQPVETLFIFGTNRNALNEVINTLKVEKELEATFELNVNEMVQDYTLLIPVYKESKKLYLEKDPQKFPLSHTQLKILKEYFNSTDDRILAVCHNISPELLRHIKMSFDFDKYYNISPTEGKPPFRIVISKILNHFNLNLEDFEKFKLLEDEIIHFKKIRFFFENIEENEKLKEKIRKVANYYKKQTVEDELRKLYGKLSPEEYKKRCEEISRNYSKEESFKNLKIKYVAEHYYLPLILSTKEKIDYIKHVIKTDNEVIFLRKLEKFLEMNKDKLKLDRWVFSKIDEHLDEEIYIPYYDRESNMIRKFIPDFVFWLNKAQNYFIVFVDPKSIKYTDFTYKVDGFKRIFGKVEAPKTFKFEKFKIIVSLQLFTEDKNKLSEDYRDYWFDNPSSVFDFVKQYV